MLDAEVNPSMPRKQIKAVPEGNGPVPHHHDFGSGELTTSELYRTLEENFDMIDKNLGRMTSSFDRRLDELIGKVGETN